MARVGSSGLNIGDVFYHDVTGDNYSCARGFCGGDGCECFFAFSDGKLFHMVNDANNDGLLGWHNRITRWDGNYMYASDVLVTEDLIETLKGYTYMGGPANQELDTFENLCALVSEGEEVYVSMWTDNGATYICGHSCMKYTSLDN